MSRIIETFTSAFNQALSTGLNYKLQKMQIQQQSQALNTAATILTSNDADVQPHEDVIHPIHVHGSTNLSGVTYDPVAKIVNNLFPTASTEEKVEYYNAIESGLQSAQMFLQHCKNQDIQLRILQLNANGTVESKELDESGEIVQTKSAVYFNTLSEFYEKGKDLYKQATNVKFIGSIVQIRNTSGDNGNALDVSIAMKTSNQDDLTDAESYDGSGSNISVYNKQSFTKFLPSSRYAYKTESLQKILSAFTSNPDWDGKKEEIYAKLAELLDTDVETLMKAGSSLRCISKNKP